MEAQPLHKDRELFDDAAPHYVRKDLNPYSRLARKLRLDRTLRNIRPPLPSILEIGCGAGFASEYLKGCYERYTGLDYSQEMIAQAGHRFKNNKIRFICGDITHFVSPERYPLILMIGVLHHLPDPARVLENLKSLLTPGGVVIANEPQRGNPLISLMRWIRKKIDPRYTEDQVEFAEDDIKNLFKNCGYETRVFPQGVLSTPFAESLIFPRWIGIPLARLAGFLDPFLEWVISPAFLRKLSWNMVIEARVVHERDA